MHSVLYVPSYGKPSIEITSEFHTISTLSLRNIDHVQCVITTGNPQQMTAFKCPRHSLLITWSCDNNFHLL